MRGMKRGLNGSNIPIQINCTIVLYFWDSQIYWSNVLTELFSYFLKKSNQGRYKFLDLNFDLSLDTLYFYRKITEWVINKIEVPRDVRLWPDFLKIATHGFKEFSWWKGFLFAWSYRPFMFPTWKITK